MAVVYFHKRKDTNEIFYVGIGDVSRPYNKYGRNRHWNHIVEKVGYDVEIIHTDLTWEDASELEIKYIKEFGRRDLGLGKLVNMTDGGEGMENPSDETRRKLSESRKGEKNHNYNKPLSESTKQKLSDFNMGKKLSDETRVKMSNSRMGENHFMYGKKHKEESRLKMSLSKIGRRALNSKLSNDDVLWIRKNYIPKDKIFGGTAMSKKYNLTKSTISGIINRKTYTDI